MMIGAIHNGDPSGWVPKRLAETQAGKSGTYYDNILPGFAHDFRKLSRRSGHGSRERGWSWGCCVAHDVWGEHRYANTGPQFACFALKSHGFSSEV